ncbi:MAG TPA: PspA/IM30 family protein [Gemmataceae bacterium]|nr:PspA/IM30 family protein [Gemmataceae bacterium]
MIFGKVWAAFRAQLNKLANFFWTADPIAQMQYEYDTAVEQLKEGRQGLEQYRALVDRVGRQVATGRARVSEVEAKIRAFLQAGQREAAAECALQLQRFQKDLSENETQLKMHEEAYNNNLNKVKHASGKLAQVKEKIQKYDAELKMSRAEAEMAKLAQDFNFDVTTDFGQIEQVIQDKIGLNRAKARVAADLSGQGIEQIKQEQVLEKAQAEMALQQFEAQMGLRTPETTQAAPEAKELGPAKETVKQSS